MSQYADYTFYSESYYGTEIPQDKFPKLCQEASGYIDKITYRRIIYGAAVTDSVRLAVCAVADVLYAQQQKDSASIPAGVTSVNNDGYSVSYATAEQRHSEIESEKWTAAGNYLPLSDPLRYAGVS